MSGITFVNNTYAGEALKGFMASTLLGGNAVARGLITVRPNVKFRETVLDLDDTVVLQPRSAKFIDQGTTLTQNETWLNPVIYEFMKEQDYSALIKSWESRDVSAGSFGDYESPTALSDFMVSRYLDKIAIANERLYYLGGTNTSEYAGPTYTGLLDLFESGGTYKISLLNYSQAITGIDATGVATHAAPTGTFRSGDVVTIVGSSGTSKDTSNSVTGVSIEGQSYFIKVISATSFQLGKNYLNINNRNAPSFSGTSASAQAQFINVSNVLPVLSSIYSQIDYADRVQPDLTIQVPLHVLEAYKVAQSEKATNVLNAFTEDKSTNYLGMALEGMNHWKGNTIAVARTSNLFLGVDLLGDESKMDTIYMRPTTADDVVRMKATMKSCVNYKFANEILFFRPSAT